MYPGSKKLGIRAAPHQLRSASARCGMAVATEQLVDAARSGRVAAQSAEAQASRAHTQRRNALAQWGWLRSSQPAWLNESIYAKEIQPRLAGITVRAISLALGVSESYAADVRAGRRRPHPRHWQALAELAGVSPNS